MIAVLPMPPPPIPKDHPLRDLYEAEREATLIRLAALNRALGYPEGNARERRERGRRGNTWQNDDQADDRTT